MSGICGILMLDGGPADAEAGASMLAAISHLGGDARGSWCDGPLFLGQQSRWITPEEQGEHLSGVGLPEGYMIAFDGRLDGRDELTVRLGIPNPCREPDSRLALSAYRRWGEACGDYLLGDYTFVLWDPGRRRLFGCADPMGSCPLYYIRKGALFAFASEPQALFRHPTIERRLNWRKLARLYWPATVLMDKGRSCFEDVERLEGGMCFALDDDRFVLRRYWTLDQDAVWEGTHDDYLEAMRETLYLAIADRMRSRVPVGALLSGGLDSSSIVAAAADLSRADGRRLATFSAVTDPQLSKAKDERGYIDAFASHPGLERVFVTAAGRGPFDDLDRILAHRDGPMLTSRHYLYAAFAAAARERGIRVILDGAGGEQGPSLHADALYLIMLRKGQWHKLARELRLRGRHERRSLLSLIRQWLIRPMVRTLPGFEGRGGGAPVNPYLNEAVVREVLGEELEETRARVAALRRPAKDLRNGQLCAIEAVRTRRGGGFAGSGVVGMTWPFHDRRLLELALACPEALRLHDGYDRYPLRIAMAHRLPGGLAWRTSKGPFSPDYRERYDRQRTAMARRLPTVRSGYPALVDATALRETLLGGGGNDQMHAIPFAVYLLQFLSLHG
ncbi:asparagine synthase (glutamine-hydrolyzing) [Thioflavicoccus mobilis 8321]|uniref:asparagine synthase (glutamine-hydrolyzing) n=1 Tax=Thioflavicoccus mobilis 8321 TaxID=765912 RepID=L0H3J6_9GAMM|nr:asparagine synthetase B [Thioflavicoccus mobilis]AGA92245.1 asparagine synthase (glutamine-hydrolyzing) [Thioflavicoccus mobilis 8321]